MEREKVVVLGGGSWGTALAHLLATGGHEVTLWMFEPELAARTQKTRINDVFLPDVTLPSSILVTNDIELAVRGKRIVISMGPPVFARSVCSLAAPLISGDAMLVNAAKGLEPQTLKRMSEVLGDVFPGALPDKIATLSGPTFAAEVSKMRPAAVVVGARNQEIAARLQRMLHTPYFRPYTNQDIVGVEFGGSLKNIVAIASGIVEGLGLGQNSQAALITRGLSEITRLGAANGARPVTFQGLSGIGDLVLTCTSRQSRNYSVGVELAQGKSLKSIVSGMTSVAEGVTTSRTAIQLAERCNVEMPITRQMFEVLFENKPPSAAIDDLLKRPLKEEMSW
ncbi:MAG: glycerol-3-phosphate dehydrogenase [Candidatus Coatesbacteria bacterium]|nr:MAG: glycerol-3-phosphate dehydrogenase [Candidatus Coatesbacteria bacterium]